MCSCLFTAYRRYTAVGELQVLSERYRVHQKNEYWLVCKCISVYKRALEFTEKSNQQTKFKYTELTLKQELQNDTNNLGQSNLIYFKKMGKINM